MAKTMRNLVAAIQSGEAKHLKASITALKSKCWIRSYRNAQRETLRKKYPSYADQEKQKAPR